MPKHVAAMMFIIFHIRKVVLDYKIIHRLVSLEQVRTDNRSNLGRGMSRRSVCFFKRGSVLAEIPTTTRAFDGFLTLT